MSDLLNQRLSRRTLLRIGGCAVVTAMAGGAGAIVATQTDLLDRLQGVTDTEVLARDAWDYADGTLTIDLERVPDLAALNTALRLEDDAMPEPLLIVHGADDDYYVFVNLCSHNQRKVDPVEGMLKCVCPSHSTFDYAGTVLSGPAKTGLTTYAVTQAGESLVVTLS
ncbi:ubiquinol-cytochrome c reductase iron-sulfur subunit [Aggregatilinea lenta]|uniref:QcrA and Rieske domain-containing protein n=1 Tax=Aggregatilinea lenta TaxID=913108 RepID=UPI000E5BCA02|nr:Rieske 2Fe-2S domain-containing protein [Aggregatilinea lenta]